jgi:hypothetical protein
LEVELRKFKAQIAGNARSIAKICNDDVVRFSAKMDAYE